MDDVRDLYCPLPDVKPIDHNGALNYFAQVIAEEVEEERAEGRLRVGDDVLFYGASVLAHFSETSSFTGEGFPTPTNMSQVFNQFYLMAHQVGTDPDLLEMGASQSLLLVGFFRDQVKRSKYNVPFLDRLTSELYLKASRYSRDDKTSCMLKKVSRSVVPLARIFRDLHVTLHNNTPNQYPIFTRYAD